MIERFDPVQMQLTTCTLEYLQDIYDKYQKVSELRGLSLPDTLKEAQAAILTKNDFFFFKMIKEVNFNYDLELITIKDEWQKLLAYILRNKEMIFTSNHIEIDGVEYPHDEYNEFFPFQNNLIEFVAVSFIANKVVAVEEKINSQFTQQELLNIGEAQKLTGYPAKRLQYLAQVLPNDGGSYSERSFNRQDLINYMYRREATNLEVLL